MYTVYYIEVLLCSILYRIATYDMQDIGNPYSTFLNRRQGETPIQTMHEFSPICVIPGSWTPSTLV